MTAAPDHWEPLDPFDLPEWLGTDEVTWHATSGLRDGHHVTGRLAAPGHDDVACDLLAVDEAHPVAVADDAARHATHQAWRHGQVHTASRDGRLTLLTPGTTFTADGTLETLGRLAKAVGARPDRFAVHLRIGG